MSSSWLASSFSAPRLVRTVRCWGHRDAGGWVDTLQLRGFSRDCCGWRRRKTSLMVADEVLIERRVDGSALTVLREVLSWEKES